MFLIFYDLFARSVFNNKLRVSYSLLCCQSNMSMNVSLLFFRFILKAGAKVQLLFNPASFFGNFFLKISSLAKRQDFVIFAEGKGNTLFPFPQIFFS